MIHWRRQLFKLCVCVMQDELERIKKETERRTKLIGGSRFIQLTDELPCDLNLLECPCKSYASCLITLISETYGVYINRMHFVANK